MFIGIRILQPHKHRKIITIFFINVEYHPYLNFEHIAQDTHILIVLLEHAKIKRAPKYNDHMFDIDIGDMVLTEEQRYIMDNIQSPQGVYIFTMLLVLIYFLRICCSLLKNTITT